MADFKQVKVWLATESKPVILTCHKDYTAEELCVDLCNKDEILPRCRPLFALRIIGTNYFLTDNSRIFKHKREYELRIRFKVSQVEQLQSLDVKAFKYYFWQVRNDLNNNKISEIKYPVDKNAIIGFGVADMYRAYIENNADEMRIKRDCKKYIPSIIWKKHGSHAKKNARSAFKALCMKSKETQHDVIDVMSYYLKAVYKSAPNYLEEEYQDIERCDGADSFKVNIMVAPFGSNEYDLRIYDKSSEHTERKSDKITWSDLCKIEDIVYMTRQHDLVLEVATKTKPIYLKFNTEIQLLSFISICSGYYRLMVNWNFNLSKDDETPSLKQLLEMKCHGPVGGPFAYRKLKEKYGNQHGCYIFRQCEQYCNVYCFDVCSAERTTNTYKLEKVEGYYVCNGVKFASIDDFINTNRDPDGEIYLNQCVPPLEYDKTELTFLSRAYLKKNNIRINPDELEDYLKDNKSPRCLSTNVIMLYSGSDKLSTDGKLATYDAFWRLNDTRKLKVAYKTSKDINYKKDFSDMANKWSLLQSSAIVRLYGITLSPDALVMEHLPLGTFDKYLREKKCHIKPIHLLRVAADLAWALYSLSAAAVVHGFIRCRKLLVMSHDKDGLVVKLSCPTLRNYDVSDTPWIPTESFKLLTLAKNFASTDMWAFATTIWEIFSYGESPYKTDPKYDKHQSASSLPRPPAMPLSAWRVVARGWGDGATRPRPQALLRDLRHLLYEETHPRPSQCVEEIVVDDSFSFNDSIHDQSQNSSDAGNTGSYTSTNYSSDIQSEVGCGSSVTSCPGANLDEFFWNHPPLDQIEYNDNLIVPESVLGDATSRPAPCDGPRLMQPIDWDGQRYLVELGHEIGAGNYGKVYKAEMQIDSESARIQVVAAKKLIMKDDKMYKDFENELSLMKTLGNHENIVKLHGYWMHPSEVVIVMEYLKEGSLNHYLKQNQADLHIKHLLKYALDIAEGMRHISDQKIIHRDLAARNILVVNRNLVKITDFGLARKITEHEGAYRVKTSERELPMDWYAPESAVPPYGFSRESDVWSFGVTAWEVFGKAQLPVPKFDTKRTSSRASDFRIPPNCPPEIFKQLMLCCWQLDPQKRPLFRDLARTIRALKPHYDLLYHTATQ